jgi:recombinational DNA repair protein (RecF pathway)
MRHKYEARAIVLARHPHGEANAVLMFAAEGLGIIRGRAQGVRKAGAKLAPALATFAESDVNLVKGKEGWRVAGAVLREPWFQRLADHDVRRRAARVGGLLLRLAPAEDHGHDFFDIIEQFFNALLVLPSPLHEAAEHASVIQILARLGLDSHEVIPVEEALTSEALCLVQKERTAYIHRINHGIAASGL